MLINNAGLGMIPCVKTPQGFEPTLGEALYCFYYDFLKLIQLVGANVMGTAYLTKSLLPLISASDAGRVIFV